MIKSELRTRLRELRSGLEGARRQEAARQAYLRLREMSAPRILSFASFLSEIDLWEWNTLLASQGRLLLPRVDGEKLRIYAVTNIATQLRCGCFGILEPTDSPEIELEAGDIILVPGLGFDKQRHRLGYGGGYYDRLLTAHPDAISYGIGFREQQVDALPVQPHDCRLTNVFLF